MIHERLDLQNWINAFPLPSSKDELDVSSTVSGPKAVAYIEQIRDRIKDAQGKLGPPVPLDLCIWKLGDSPNREITKVGGVPYWPANEPWPHLDRRTPLTFVAQLCFADSHDILPVLPGDMLSIFAAENDYSLLHVRWLEFGNEELTPPKKLPKPRWHIEPCHAVLHRTADYPQANWKLFQEFGYPIGKWCRRLTNCTKIGGAWQLRGEIGDPEDCDDPQQRMEIETAIKRVNKMEQQFIAQICSITPSAEQPFVNVATWKSVPTSRASDLLKVADVGGYDFFFDGENTQFDWWSS
jgi:hypothetical protein